MYYELVLNGSDSASSPFKTHHGKLDSVLMLGMLLNRALRMRTFERDISVTFHLCSYKTIPSLQVVMMATMGKKRFRIS